MLIGAKRAAGAAVILAMMAVLAVPVAAQQVKPGQWRYSTTVDMPAASLPSIPPEQLAKLPPKMRARIELMMHGHAVEYSACLTSDKPVPRMPKNRHCTIERMSRDGATLTWSASCKLRHGQVDHADAVATYSGDRMAMDMTIHGTGPDGKPMTLHQHTSGRYVGPCKAK